MGYVIGKIIAWGVPTKFARPVAYIGLTLLILAALWGGKCAYDASVIAKHDAKVEARARPATDKAADERARDTIAAANNERITRDEIAAQPDQPISPTSRALACKRLSNAGRGLPAACRSERSDRAQARPD